LDGKRRGRILGNIKVEIIHTNELKKEYVWAVQIYKTDECLDSFPTYQEAEKYCENNGYMIKGYGKRTVPNVY